MRSSRWVGLLLVPTVALFSASCGNDGESTGAGGSSGAAVNSGAGSTAGGTSSVAGSASSGASTGGSAGGSGRIYTSRPDLCTPRCEDSGGYCALIDKGGCSGAKPCVVEAECRQHTECVLAAGDQKCGLGKCIDKTDDDCAMAGCPGRCLCNVKACPDGQAFNEDAAVCACVPAVTPPLDCGDIDCPDGTDCETVLDSAICVKRFAR